MSVEPVEAADDCALCGQPHRDPETTMVYKRFEWPTRVETQGNALAFATTQKGRPWICVHCLLREHGASKEDRHHSAS